MWTNVMPFQQLLLAILIASAGCGDQPDVSEPPETRTHQNRTAMTDAKSECEEILNTLMPFAEQMLAKHGEFIPFGAAMAPDGTITSIAGSTGEERPRSLEVMEVLREGFRAGAAKGEYKATGLAYDILATPPSTEVEQDAIAVALDHRDGYSVVVVFPYSTSSGEGLVVDAPFAVAGEDSIFSR